jgi:sec-independent protein translocase protein TatA
MFGLGIPELIIIFVIALIIFGPKKLPDLGKSIGRAMAEFKKASDDFQETVRSEMKEVEKTANLEEVKKLGTIDLSTALDEAKPAEGERAPEKEERPVQPEQKTGDKKTGEAL